MTVYNIDPTTKVVLDGPYQGEIVAPCSELSGTMRLPDVLLSRDEGVAIRSRHNLNTSQFHLDIESPVNGVYCMAYKNPSMNKSFVDNFKCSYVGESPVMAWFRDLVPFMETSRCSTVKKGMKPFLPHEEPGELAKLWDGTRNGLTFAVGMAIVDRVLKRYAGWSPLESALKTAANWMGRGGPGSAGGAGGAASGAGEGSGASGAPPAAEAPGGPPQSTFSLPSIPVPTPEEAAKIGTWMLIMGIMGIMLDSALKAACPVFIIRPAEERVEA
ncbi:MAG: hypothetical protein V2A66_10295 [Pseudomonadota bacterium]